MHGESQIFISHAKEDNHVISRILKILDDEGIKNWVDIKQLDEIDSSINESINLALSTSDYFLLIWSKHAKKSKYVKREYNSAISDDYDKRLKKIILRLDNTVLPPLLADTRYHKIKDIAVEEVISNIIKKLKPKNTRLKQKQFDDFLNVSYDAVKIIEREYKPALAFKRVDKKRYNEELGNWLQNE